MFLYGIGIKTAKRAPLQALQEARVSVEEGIAGDVRGKGGRDRRRQVTVISMNQWREVCTVMGWLPEEHSWMLRRAGLCLEGVWFHSARHAGQFIRVGGEVVLEITGETTPCERMDEIAPGLKAALSGGRGGVTCRVVQGGRIAVRDHAVVRNQNPL